MNRIILDKKILSVAICATPNRWDNLLQVIESIKINRPDITTHVFMEPTTEENILNHQIENVELHINNEQLGCFANHANALNRLTDNTDTKYIIISQDDFVFHEQTNERIQHAIKHLNNTHGFGFLGLYTSPKKKKFIWKQGRQEINFGYSSFGVSYFMERETLNSLQQHPFYINHLVTYEKNQQVDSTIGYVMERFNKSTYYHNPSLVKHIGDSLIGHYDPEKNTFVHVDTPKIYGMLTKPADLEDKQTQIGLASLFGQIDKIALYNTDISTEDINNIFINIEPKLLYPKEYVRTSLDYMEQFQTNISRDAVYPHPDTDNDGIVFDKNDYIPEPLFGSVLNMTTTKETNIWKVGYNSITCIPHKKNLFNSL